MFGFYFDMALIHLYIETGKRNVLRMKCGFEWSRGCGAQQQQQQQQVLCDHLMTVSGKAQKYLRNYRQNQSARKSTKKPRGRDDEFFRPELIGSATFSVFTEFGVESERQT